MSSAKVIYSKKIEVVKDIFEARITILEVPKPSKYPDGIKLRCILLNLEDGIPVLLVDNHEPYGYHMHTKLPHDRHYRVPLAVNHHKEAISIFWQEVKKVVKNEI